jgi:hypothetical protein
MDSNKEFIGENMRGGEQMCLLIIKAEVNVGLFFG